MSEKELDDRLMEEYREIGVNWRYWGEVRFKQLTVFLTATGVLGAAAFSEIINLSSQGLCVLPEETCPRRPEEIRLLISLVGIILTALFYILEERATYYRRSYLHRALEIEKLLSKTDGGSDLRDCTICQYHVTHNQYWHKARSEYIFRTFFMTIILAWSAYAMTVQAIPRGWKWVTGGMVALLLVIGWELAGMLQLKAGLLDERRETISGREPRKEWKGIIYRSRQLYNFVLHRSEKK